MAFPSSAEDSEFQGRPAIERAILGDGSAIHVRPIEPGDKLALRRAFERLSPESRYRRFLGPLTHLDAGQLAYFTEVDHHDHEALVAIEPDHGQLAGIARYVRLTEDPQAAEVAIAVADDWHGRGVGTLLLHELSERARAAAVTRFVAICLSENAAVIDLLERLGSARLGHPEPGLTELTIELPQETMSTDRLHRALREVAAGNVEVQSQQASEARLKTHEPERQ